MDSPYYRLHKQHPDYSVLQVLGSRCFPYLGVYRQKKLDPKSLACVFIGYNTKHKGYKCIYPPTGKSYISRHVIFDEFVLPFCKLDLLYGSTSAEGEFSSFETTSSIPSSVFPPPPIPQIILPDSTSEPLNQCQQQPIHDPIIQEISTLESSSGTAIPPAPHIMVTRSKVGIRKPNPKYENLHTLSPIPDIPKSIISAKKHPGWTIAMQEALTALAENNT